MTTRIAIVADSHVDEHSRFQECIDLHEWIQCDASERRCSLLLHSGDLFERRSTPRERVAVVNWLTEVAQSMPVILVRGNHDALEEHDLWPQLRTEHPIRTHDATGLDLEAGVMVASMAWPQKAHIDAAGADEREAMRAVLRGFGDLLEQHDGPRILLAHAMVRGSRTSTGQELMGCALELGLEDLALARADLYALGHIHAHQHFMVGDAPAIYPGSPRRANFGELEPKGYVVAEFDGRQLVGWEFVEVPATRMIHVESHWYDEHIGLPGDVVVPSGLSVDWTAEEVAASEVRLRFHVASEHRDAAKRDAQAQAEAMREAGAVSVKLEECVEASTRARNPEVAAAKSLADKLAALWEARKDVPPPERAATIVSKLGELEGAAA